MKNNNFTYRANNWLLQYPHFTVVALRQYHKNFSNINKRTKEIPINASSQTKPNGNADSKQRLIISQQVFKFHKSQVNTEEQLSAAKQRFHHNRCKNMPTIFHQSYA